VSTAAAGRAYTGRVLQLVSGSTGLDDWEYGVTLFAHDLADVKSIVYTLRYDEASVRYAEFGPS
jgi:hydrogen peroxide-dependent heme synthase